MRSANLCLTIVASLAAIVASAALFHAANPGFEAVCLCWTGLPYLAHCIIACAMRRDRDASKAILIGTVLSAVAADLVYLGDLWPFIEGRSRGVEVMNCAGPLIELGVPILQWLFFGFLWGIAGSLRSPEIA